MRKKKHEIVCVENGVLGYNYSDFSVNEFRLWLACLAQVRDTGEMTVSIEFDDFSELTGIANDKPKYIADVFFGMSSKVQTLTELRSDDGFKQLWFFQKNEVDPKARVINISVNPEYVKYVNNLLGNFTRFKLSEVRPLRTRAAQELYLKFKKDIYKEEVVYVPLGALRKRLGIEKYETRDVTEKIIKPAVEEINRNNALGFVIEYRVIKKGRNIIGYELAQIGTFTKPKDLQEYSEEWDSDEPF